jgi:2-polyprenyl-3-methyl-5-hydroxy-6-metoxy-1,4-benzoquinol methylase
MRRCIACSAEFVSADWMCPSCGRQPDQRDGIVYLAPALCEGDHSDATYTQDALASAEHTHFWFRGRAKLLVWALRHHFPRAASLLDVGCGRGSILVAMRDAFPDMSFAGGELLDAGLRLAHQQLPGVDLYQMDARALPFDREFDVVTSCDVLEHLDDDAAVTRELFRAVKPGGGLIVTVPQHQWLWSAVDAYSHHRRRYARRQLTAVIESAGFVIERVTSFVTALLPLMLLSRATKRELTDDFDPTAELRIGGVTNRILERVLDVERGIIQAGVSLPIGSSLMAIARRPSS